MRVGFYTASHGRAVRGPNHMFDYRLYCLDGAGRIGLADWIQAADDDSAIAQARRARPDAHRCEIWQKNRLVAKLNGQGRFEQTSD